MSKKEVLKAEEAVEVMRTTGVPAQETEGAGVVMATEIIADLKEQLQEAKEEAKAVTEDWMFVLGQREILRKKMDIINFVLKFHDYKLRIISSRRKKRKNRRAKSDEKMYINTGPLQRSNRGRCPGQQR